MKQIFKAVAYCHNIGIVHRDLKPENILLEINENQFNVKIIDFGTSRPFKPNQKLTERTGTPYYIAPEVLRKQYDHRCDLWSIGVIMFILLTGIPPLNGKNDKEIIHNVQTAVIDYSAYSFSPEAKDLISKLLQRDPLKRISAPDALQHSWINNLCPNLVLNRNMAKKALQNLKCFRADQKLQEATIAFIVNQLVSKEETQELKKVFMELDTNNDGQLSYEEIVNGYKKFYGSGNPTQIADIIFEKVDADKNGSISYEEFIRATIDLDKVINEKKLEYAFKLFDQNGDGFIQANEIKNVLGKDMDVDDEIWKTIIQEVDLNGDGEITLDEFRTMMEKILKNY